MILIPGIIVTICFHFDEVCVSDNIFLQAKVKKGGDIKEHHSALYVLIITLYRVEYEKKDNGYKI
jgi:hypothetical protein